jgi:hypothetical protein
MHRIALTLMVAGLLMVMMAVPAFATIHPIVESFDCANEQAFEHHPLGDPADPPGQTPGQGSHSDQSTLRGFTESNEEAQFGHKLDGKCGKVGQS